MTSPWDLRTALLAKHAQHVVLIHFPIALGMTGVLFDLLAAWTKRQELAMVAYWNLTGAAFTAIPTAITGLLAWQFELEGRALRGILLLHLLAASASILLILTICYLHHRQRRHSGYPPQGYRLPLEIAAVLAITLTGYLGGFLTGVNHS